MIKVYLVEDEPLVRRGIISILPFARYGMQLVGDASSAEEALPAIGSQDVDLVFTDISMPGMNGLDFIRVLRDKHPKVRTVVLTCHQDFDYLQQALRLGAMDYMVKTQFDDQSVDALLGRVSTQIHQTAAAEEREKLQETQASTQKEELFQRWKGLSWLVKDTEFEELMLRSEERLSLSEWRDHAASAHRNWSLICPVLEKLQSGEPELADMDSFADLKGWLSSYRREAMRLLRDTMHSEDVIDSIIRSLDIISRHEGNKLSQSDICKAINMSISYFSKCFKEIVGISFVNYMQDRNIRLAQHLLHTTNYPVYQIAEQSGFQDEKYFGKIFRMKNGIAPSEYRLQSRKG
ncbi:response regulator [Paenibacillus sp. S150]|uniref:response regulator transcription factor n=1 Tax=Paenibacillus sp. S150 TaxID=2749826 RepID=UPI001C58A705|nr:response regulator [Paenibacillus sp. S150]MBW4079934.1 response regulator [Paenibacillus sp. S150]